MLLAAGRKSGFPQPQGGCVPKTKVAPKAFVATLGAGIQAFLQPQRGCDRYRCVCRNPVGVGNFSRQFPRVARASQPWAGSRSLVEAEQRWDAAGRFTALPQPLLAFFRFFVLTAFMATLFFCRLACVVVARPEPIPQRSTKFTVPSNPTI